MIPPYLLPVAAKRDRPRWLPGQIVRPTQTLALRRACGELHLDGLVTFGIRIIEDLHGATDRFVHIERLISLVSEQGFVFAAPPTWYRPCDARFGLIEAAPGIESGRARAVPLSDSEKIKLRGWAAWVT